MLTDVTMDLAGGGQSKKRQCTFCANKLGLCNEMYVFFILGMKLKEGYGGVA